MTPDTLLFRQAHPNFMDAGQPTSQVFCPFPKDHGHLSVYNGDLITASDSHAHYTVTLGFLSQSVWTVTKAEADGASVPASTDPRVDFPSHAKIDFSGKTDKECRKIAKRLKSLAIASVYQYLPPEHAAPAMGASS